MLQRQRQLNFANLNFFFTDSPWVTENKKSLCSPQTLNSKCVLDTAKSQLQTPKICLQLHQIIRLKRLIKNFLPH